MFTSTAGVALAVEPRQQKFTSRSASSTGAEMNFAPLWADGPVISVHALAALAAFAIGASQLAMRKGTARHRFVGWVWVSLMAVVALSSFWIHEFRVFGPFSPIHILSVLTLATLVYAVRSARAGRIAAHKSAMTFLFLLAIMLTGAFTLLPGRTMHAVLFGG
jgi:uncharacterized membrane protein